MGRAASAYLVSGLLRCKQCSSTMSGFTRGADRSHATRRSYCCYLKRVVGGCEAPDVSQDVVEADLLAVLRTMALPPGFAKVVDTAVAARMRTYGAAKTISAAALAERAKRLNDLYEWGKIDADELAAKGRKIDEQRAHLTVRPAPLFTQQQSVLETLVSAWEGMNAGEKKRTLAGIFDSITASADGVDRLEPCEDWRPFMVAAIPNPVLLAEDVEGVNGAEDGTRSPETYLRLAAPIRRPDCACPT